MVAQPRPGRRPGRPRDRRAQLPSRGQARPKAFEQLLSTPGGTRTGPGPAGGGAPITGEPAEQSRSCHSVRPFPKTGRGGAVGPSAPA